MKYDLYFTGAGVPDEFEKTVDDQLEALEWVSRMPCFRKYIKRENNEVPNEEK